MKWLLIWTAIINGEPVSVTDEDNPDTFETVEACAAQAQELAPKIDALLNRSIAAMQDVKVIGECVPIDDSNGEGS